MGFPKGAGQEAMPTIEGEVGALKRICTAKFLSWHNLSCLESTPKLQHVFIVKPLKFSQDRLSSALPSMGSHPLIMIFVSCEHFPFLEVWDRLNPQSLEDLWV